MNKKILFALNLAAVLSLSACGGATDSSTTAPIDTTKPTTNPPITTPESDPVSDQSDDTPTSSVTPFDPYAFFDDALTKDYSNATIESIQQYNDGQDSEYDMEYCSDGYYVNYTPDLATAGLDPYIYYYVENGVSYQHFERDRSNPKSKDGWLNKGANDIDLSIWNTYFYLPMLLNNLTSADVEFYGDLGTTYAYFVDSSVARALNETAFRYAWFNEILDVTIYVNKDGYINHIQGFSDVDPNKTENFVDIKIKNIGATSLPLNTPAKPTEETKLEYWQYKGWDSDYTDAYLTGIEATLEPGLETDATHDAVLDLEHTATITYSTLPETFKPWEVVDKTVKLHSTDPSVASIAYGNDQTAVVTALKEGETEVYLSIQGQNGTIESQHFKIKVRGVKEQDKTDAVYEFDFVAIDNNENITATNKLTHSKAPYTIKSNKGKMIDGKYSSIFENGKDVFTIDPLTTDFSKPAGASVSFDFGEQQVSGLSVYYGIFYESQMSHLSKLDKAVIRTSNDGSSWNEIDILSILKKEASSKNKKLLETTFAPASKVELYLHSNMVGNSLAVALDNFVFTANEECHDYVPVEDIHVESVSVLPETLKLTTGETSTLTASVLPTNAQNKDVVWTSANPDIVSVDVKGNIEALKPGVAKVYATSVDGEIKSNEVAITVNDPVKIPEAIDGTFRNDIDYPELTVTVDHATNSLDVIFEEYHTVLPLVGVDQEIYEFRNGDDVLYLSLRDPKKLGVNTTTSKLNGKKLVPIHQELFKVIELTSFDVVVVGKEVNPDGKYHLLTNDSVLISTKNFAPADCNVKDLKWTVSNGNARFDEETSSLYALAEGEVTLTATALHNEDVKSSVTFVIGKEVKPTSIAVSSKTGATEVKKGEKLELSLAFNEGCNRTDVEWSVDNRSIATVDQNGVVTAKAAGVVKVTATSTYDKSISGSITLTVTSPTSQGMVPSHLHGSWLASDDDWGYSAELTIDVRDDNTIYVQETMIMGGDVGYFTLNEELSNATTLHYENDDGSGDYIEITFDESGMTSVVLDDTNSGAIFGGTVTFSTVVRNN